MSQTLQSPNFSQLPGNEMSEKHFKDARLQAPESSWTANLDEYRKKALMTRPGSEVFVVKQSNQPFPADSNEAYNLRTVNQSNQPEFRSQNLPADKSTVQQVGSFTVRVKDEQGREINDPTVRVREKEEMLQQPAAEFREASKQFPPNPFSGLKEGEMLYPLEDLDDGRLSPMHPKLAHQGESGLRPEDLMAYEQLPEVEEQEPLLGEGNFPRSDAMPSNEYTGEMVRPGEGDFPRREVPSIREEGEMVQLGSFPTSEMRGRNRDAYFGDSEFPKSKEMRGEVSLQKDAPAQELRSTESKSTREVREQQMESKVTPDADVQIQSSFKPVMKEETIGNKPSESGFITRQEEINPVVGPPELAQGAGPPTQEPETVQPVRGEQPSHEHHSFIGKLKHIFEHDKK